MQKVHKPCEAKFLNPFKIALSCPQNYLGCDFFQNESQQTKKRRTIRHPTKIPNLWPFFHHIKKGEPVKSEISVWITRKLGKRIKEKAKKKIKNKRSVRKDQERKRCEQLHVGFLGVFLNCSACLPDFFAAAVLFLSSSLSSSQGMDCWARVISFLSSNINFTFKTLPIF